MFVSMTDWFCLYCATQPVIPQQYTYYFLSDEWPLIGDDCTMMVSYLLLFEEYFVTDLYYS